jgi:hypothetical protein
VTRWCLEVGMWDEKLTILNGNTHIINPSNISIFGY